MLKWYEMVKFWAELCSCALRSSWLQPGPADRWHVPACVQWSNVLDGTAQQLCASVLAVPLFALGGKLDETGITVKRFKSGFSNDSNHSKSFKYGFFYFFSWTL